MTGLLLYSVACFGVSFAIGHSQISLPFRKLLNPTKVIGPIGVIRAFLVALVECPPCLGFWCGLAYGFAFRPSWAESFYVTDKGVIELALYSCGSNLILARVVGLIKES